MQLSNRRIKEIASLRHRKYRERLGQYIVEGARAVDSALEAGAALREIVIRRGDAYAEQMPWSPAVQHERIAVVDEETFQKLSAVETSQGVLAVLDVPDQSTERVLAAKRILALDAVQDPGNAGTLIRTAAWFGIDAVVAGAGTVDLFNPKTVRAAMGGLFGVELAVANELAAFLDTASDAGFASYGADMRGEDAALWKPAERAVLVVGNEGSGLSAAVAKRIDGRVTIPGAGRPVVESLNVAQAATILMYLWQGRVSD